MVLLLLFGVIICLRDRPGPFQCDKVCHEIMSYGVLSVCFTVYNRLTKIENRFMAANQGLGEKEWIGRLGLADEN